MIQIGKTLALAIRQKRTQLHYSQEFMAFKLKQTQNAYCKVELGQTKVTLVKLIDICEVFEVDINDFLKPVIEPQLRVA
ncbi:MULTISPECIES: helix-turn-helix domain-containing protein [Mucilaginibacter]|uniref:helix-turn-helix domain-containing protein n=1 Tax=Mucilaginibacter TaxID=423349 RepID=UPI002090595C|nr:MULTISPECIES: helix-turn-helix transcriptional regulator [Mucilaginibacter]MCO5935088.1 helix-turn-helix domain-containing protein [Mucilaginibacter aurantiaciroseus]MEB0261866.1 helix-turn-helix transcriptional regulator [Mucilaginibacter sp. 10I4]MEB0278913.1 helix-turn-helix transcriptional regulator [Mucilaginibacter sp. 10B2]MEB0302884.1 helix-turn-helix transcriptional regulator [Mucilaginibacter sp. 5C4]WPX22095.1 helix-turn-helix transcriptional regulator [Mucilaginibacter sp. 5C4]